MFAVVREVESTGSYQHSNKPLGTVTDGEFLEMPKVSWVFKTNNAAWIWLTRSCFLVTVELSCIKIITSVLSDE